MNQELAEILGHPVLEPQHLTDLGNAKRLVELHGADFRYCGKLDQVFYWMGTRWVPDVTGRLNEFAEDVVQSIYLDATVMQAEAATGPGATPNQRQNLSKQAESISKWARQSENNARINAMIAMAKLRHDVQIEPDAWDANPMLLNCQNGTVNLQTRTLQPHDPNDFLTKICNCDYDTHAGYVVWDEFLERIIPDESLRSYLQRALGYSITGLTIEEKLFLPWGPPATGKSTLFRAVVEALGDYAAVAGAETFGEQKPTGDAPRSDIARLADKRMVLAMELPGNQRMATALLKQITGGDIMVARHLYHKHFQFVPISKPWLASNSRPVIVDDDPGIWRRVSQIPFEQEIPETERDPGVKLALMDHEIASPAILKWLVDGCAQWRQLGLGTPQVVRDATASYKEGMDRIQSFQDDECMEDENLICPNPAMWNRYLAWCQWNGESPLSRTGFSLRLKAKGFKQIRDSTTRYWIGIGLTSDPQYRESLL